MPDELPDTPLEHVHGAIPADPTAAAAARASFYAQLLATTTRPSTCLPEAGVHVFHPHDRTGPCRCGATNAPEEKPR